MNTRIEYLYRDADNFKLRTEVVLCGHLSADQIRVILESLQDSFYFIPSQVGLPENRFSDTTEADYCWFELEEGDFYDTKESPSVEITPAVLTKAFETAAGNWKEDNYQNY